MGAVARPPKGVAAQAEDKEDYILRYVLKYIRNKYRHSVTDKDVLNILTKDLKAGLDDKFHFEVGIYLKVIRNALETYPHWDLVRAATNSAYRRDHSNNKDLVEFSNALRVIITQILELTQREMMPNLQLLKEKCRTFPNMQDLAGALPDCTPPPTGFSTRNVRYSSIAQALPVVAASSVPLTLKTILNWPNTIVTLDLPGFRGTRHNMREVNFNLVNLERIDCQVCPPPSNINQAFLLENDTKSKGVNNKLISACLKKQKQYIEGNMTLNRKQQEDLNTIFNEFNYNLERLPANVKPGEYKIFLSRHTYYRYLFNEVPKEIVAAQFKEKFDIRMEETYPPTQHISFPHVLVQGMNKNYVFREDTPWLYVHCLCCRKRFDLSNLSMDIVFKHFMESHHDERLEWTCTNCKQTFPAKYLMDNRWAHNCQEHTKRY